MVNETPPQLSKTKMNMKDKVGHTTNTIPASFNVGNDNKIIEKEDDTTDTAILHSQQVEIPVFS